MAEFIIIPEPLATDEANAAYYIDDAKDWDQAIWMAANNLTLGDGDYRVIKFGAKADQVFNVTQNVVQWSVQRKVGDAD